MGATVNKKLRRVVMWPALLVCSSALAQGQPEYVGWLDYGDGGAEWQKNKERLQRFGEQFDFALEMYEYLERHANGGDELAWEDMRRPEFDWSGIYTRTRGGISFDPDVRGNELTAKLTSAGAAARQRKIEQIASTGGEYDPISDCRPPGHPRWATEPFLHEFIVTPDQTLLINEMVNDIRRVYTDGRDHTAPEDAYATWNGDTIGVWNDGMLLMHTMYLRAGQYQRGTQPNYSEQVEVVERWRKVSGNLVEADYWVFDQINLEAPWYTRQSWTELTNDDALLRIRYWDCGENQNNAIIVREDGTSQFPDFDFVEDDAATSNDEAVKQHNRDE